MLSGCLAESNPNSLLHPMDPIVIRLRGVEAMCASRSSRLQEVVSPGFSEYHITASKGFQRIMKSPRVSTAMSGFLLSRSLHLTDGLSIQSALKVEDIENSNGTHQLNHSSSGQIIGKSVSSISISQVLASEEICDLNRLKSLQQLRKKNKAQRVRRSLKAFVNKLAPKLHNVIYLRKMENLKRILHGMVVRKKYWKAQRRRQCACSDIQRCYRGYASRIFNHRRNVAACSIQRVMRGFRDRRIRNELRRIDILVKWMRRKVAGLLLKRAIIKWRTRIHAKKEKSVEVLQALARRAFLERRLKLRRAVRQEKERRVVVVQKIFRGKVARDTYHQLKREKISKLVSVTKNADGELGSDPDMKVELASKKISSATKIQSVYRGKSARKACCKLRTEKYARKLELERSEEIENKRRNDSARRIQTFFKKNRSNRSKQDLNKYFQHFECLHIIISIRKPNGIKDSPGYVVEVLAGTDEEDGVHVGKVIGFNESRNKIRISFDTEKEGTYYIEDIPFDSANMSWKKAPTSEQRYMWVIHLVS